MKRIKLLTLLAAILICGTASAQFTNNSNNRGQRSNSANGGGMRGYTGFVEMGYAIGIGDYNFNRLDLSTTHGFQFNSMIFIGMGTGLKYYFDGSSTGIPIFTDFRINFLDNKITPFAGFKIGYCVGDVSGFMMTPSMGFRFGIKDKLGLTVNVGYDYQRTEVTTFYYSYYSGYYFYDIHKENIGALYVKVGFEF